MLTRPAPDPDPAIPAAGGAQAVDRALALLAAVGRAPPEGAPLSALAQAAGVAKPTARRLLISLMGAHLVEQDAGTRAYHLGAGAFLLGLRAGRRHDMAEQAADCVARLARAQSGPNPSPGPQFTISGWRAMMGATNPANAAPGTIRADFATTTGENVTHGSDSPESAQRELARPASFALSE